MACGSYVELVAAFVGDLRALDVQARPVEELAEACLASTRLLDAVLAHAADVAAEFQQRGGWVDDGATSAATWIAYRTGARRAEVASRVKVGAALRQLPHVHQAAVRGEISFDHVRRIVDCARRHPYLAIRDEQVLLEQARALDADMFRMAAQHWIALAEDTADLEIDPDPTPPRHESVHVTPMPDGWHRIDGELSAENGALLAAALGEHVDRALREQRDGDPALERLPISALRAEGLMEIVAQHLRREPSKASVPDRYRVAIVIRPDQFVDPPPACCDSPMFRAVLSADGDVLDIGRTSDAWPTAIRRAVGLRDGGCVFPGCDRRPSWCEIHHCQQWNDGGRTSLDNAAMLCRRHHTFIHAKRWRVHVPRPRGRPQVLRPDGTPHTIDPWHLPEPVPA